MELEFSAFFRDLHGYDPFPWQCALAKRVVAEGRWPKTIDLPTGSGKTSCLDIALFAMAAGGQAPRRVFFVVDRRVVVNEAYRRMCAIAEKMQDAREGAVAEVAFRLRQLSGGNESVSVYEMRGGIYRDPAWVHNPLQPTVVLSTVDQVGSRLLFRGYGVSESVRPMHAALIANDSLLILDEAHCSRPFSETLARVSQHIKPESNFHVVEMTATPNGSEQGFQITNEDREHVELARRLQATKPTLLVTSKARTDQPDAMAKELVAQALQLQKQSGHRRIAIMANRIATAKAAWKLLKDQRWRAQLLIGRMRPFDRDDLLDSLVPFATGNRADLEDPHFVVATQCLEVGADLDFEILVTEAASIDALLQRFGRLDRAGRQGGKACGAIVLGETKAGKPDAVYGEASANTSQWLLSLGSSEVDMGIEGVGSKTIPQFIREMPEEQLRELRMPTKMAAILLPAHIDALAQTNPEPEPSPDVSLFLHGSSDAVADVQVIWRADLPAKIGEWMKDWIHVLSLCPPGSGEAMPVRIGFFERWASNFNDADIEGLDQAETAKGKSSDAPTAQFIWRGEGSSVRRVRPGDTVILRCQDGWSDDFGHIPDSGFAGDQPKDYGDRVSLEQRRRRTLRLHPDLIGQWKGESKTEVLEKLGHENGEPPSMPILDDLLQSYLKPTAIGLSNWEQSLLEEACKTNRKKLLPYPSLIADADASGYVLTWRAKEEKRIRRRPALVDEDTGKDELSYLGVKTLERHTKEVMNEAKRFGAGSPYVDALEVAARWHDFGKADERFQAMLHGGDLLRARMALHPLAKGDEYKPGLSGKSKLPPGFRHEMLSLAAASVHLSSDLADRDLILHLIAAHHGFARPYAPIVIDEDPKRLEHAKVTLELEHQGTAAHSLSSGVSRRYWSMTRRLGWWRLAYVETLLRLADWSASAMEDGE